MYRFTPSKIAKQTVPSLLKKIVNTSLQHFDEDLTQRVHVYGALCLAHCNSTYEKLE